MDHNFYYGLLFFLLPIVMGCVGKQNEPAKNITLSALFSDHMVVQQDMPVPVWGEAEPGGRITVQFNGQTKSTVSDGAGKWIVVLDSMNWGGPFELSVIGYDTLLFKDILIGEVWLGSGQSNMEMPLAGWGKVLNYEQEIAEADYPRIRLFQVERSLSLQPEEDIPADGWKPCTPQNIPEFSSTAYFFARELLKSLNRPIGLIHSSWGGTIIEAWTSAEALKTIPKLVPQVQRIEKMAQNNISIDSLRKEFQSKLIRWQKQIDQNDRGTIQNWSENGSSDEWKTISLPVVWEQAGLKNLDGVVWFKKTVHLPKSWKNSEIQLHLGPIDDMDSTYFNGKLVGSINNWNEERIYTVPSEVVHSGANNIVVRVVDYQGNGGIWGDPEELKLVRDGSDSISIAGEWRYKVGLDLKSIEVRPLDPDMPNRPAVLNNAMIEPLIPYAIRGAIWYQGESNARNAYQYRKLFPLMINDWRNRWQQGDFPFIFVQLANFQEQEPNPGEHSWAELREAQSMALELPNTGMAVAIDIGDAFDIHPKNKQEVGRRLALNALKMVYDRDVMACSPMFKSAETTDRGFLITFKHVYDGLTTVDGNQVEGFSIAGKDSNFVWARADVMNDNQILVWHPDIKDPQAVRYAWAVNPKVNLINSAGLPAAPFRTDDWPGITKD